MDMRHAGWKIGAGLLATLLAGGLVSCANGAESLASIEYATNGHGTVSIEGLGEDKKAAVGQKLYVTATPDTDYKLETLSVNGSSIYESRSFTVELSTNYVISASFVSSVEAGEYSFTITGDRMVEVGNELQLTATVYGANKAVSYFMSDPDIARVNENGRVTALKAGFATVTATAVGSLSQDDPASASAWFYVVPSTMGKFIRQGQKGNLSKGIRYEGVLKYNIDPSSGENPDEKISTMPYEISLRNDEEKGFQADFHLDFGDNTSAITSLIAVATSNFGLMSATRFGVSYLGGSTLNVYFYSGENHDSLILYKTLDLYKDVTPTLASGIVSLVGNLIGSADASSLLGKSLEDIVKELLNEIDIGPYLRLLNTGLCYSDDAGNEISLYKDYLPTAQSYVDNLKEKAIEAVMAKIGSREIVEATLSPLFPSSLSDIRFKFVSAADDTSLHLVIKDTKTVDKASVLYTYIDLGFSYTSALVEQSYFDALSSEFSKAESEQAILAKALGYKSVVASDLKGAKSTYDAINFNSAFVKDLTTYRDYVATINDETSPNYVSNETFKTNAMIDEYKSYSGFSVSLAGEENGNVLPDLYACKSGSSFLLHDFKAVGDSAWVGPVADADLTVTLSDKTIASYDASTHLVSVTSAPSAAKDLKVSVTIKGYSKVTYRLHVLAA